MCGNSRPLYRQVMQIDDPIDNPTEATMSDTRPRPRYGYAPQPMFAATRAGAERRAREAAAASVIVRPGRASGLLQRLSLLFTATPERRG